MEAKMKGITKAITASAVLLTLGACSTMKEIEVRDTKANPAWYQDCEQIGSEGFLFWKTDYAYSCGMGESKFEQASESQAYAFAVKGFAERINGVVNSNTTVDINGNSGVETRVTRTIVEHATKNTSIREHVEVKKFAYELSSTGRVHTYVRIKMPLEVFDGLLQEAKDEKNAIIASQLNNN
jgi:hypothetical protein